MLNNVDYLNVSAQPSERRIDNSQRVLKMDPDQGGNRGSNGALADNSSGQQEARPEAPADPLTGLVIDQGEDSVKLSPAAQKIAGEEFAGRKDGSSASAAASGPDNAGKTHLIDVIA